MEQPEEHSFGSRGAKDLEGLAPEEIAELANKVCGCEKCEGEKHNVAATMYGVAQAKALRALTEERLALRTIIQENKFNPSEWTSELIAGWAKGKPKEATDVGVA